MSRPKRIFISSTCFDLIDARAELKRALQEQGYVVYASDAPDFPVHPGYSPTENCLQVVSESDIYVLIIHTRYGAVFEGSLGFPLPLDLEGTPISITFAEYLTAREKGIEVRVWVRDLIWSTCPPNPAALAAVKDSHTLPPGIEPSVYTFIHYIRNNPHEGGAWINQFHDVVDLKDSVLHWLTERAYRNEREFRTAVVELCELLGFEFDSQVGSSPENSRVIAKLRDNPFGDRDAIWAYFQPNARPVSWKHLRAGVQQAVDEMNQGLYDRALLVSSEGFDDSVAPAVARYTLSRRIKLIAFDELLSSLLPLHSYLNSVVDDFEHFDDLTGETATRDPIIAIMRRCNLLKYYVPLRARSSPTDLLEYVEEWLASNDRNQLTLLGDFGTGKSSFLLWLTYELARRVVRGEQRSQRIPLFVSLRDHAGKVDVREIIVNTLSNTYGLRNASFPAFLKLLDAGRLLVIFDGFDETATQSDPAQSLRILRELNSLVRRNSKILLSCRTHYFRTEQEAQLQLGRGLTESRIIQ
jgi:hypothetical protein